MTRKNYPHEAMIAVLEAVEEWELDDWQLANLLADLPGDLAQRAQDRSEQAWMDYQESLMSGAAEDRDRREREALKDAGRGHLLKG